jgi:WS/DGAT/MGAT family acyltransferase
MLQLSGLDASFLYLESPEMPMHVGALHIFDLPAGYRGRFVKHLRQLMADRLPLMPALRRRLWWMPNLANPARPTRPRSRTPCGRGEAAGVGEKGDGLAELQAAVGELHAQLLDRGRPLWRFHVLEGLGRSAGGHKRVGLYSQVHHAAVDGQAAVALANILFDLTPEPRAIEARPSKRTKVFRHDMAEMLRGALASEALQVGQIIRELPGTVTSLTRAAGAVISNTSLLGRSKGGSKVSNLALAPRTLLNVSVGPGRAFASLSLPLAEMKALAKAHECTLNDVVLMLCAGGLRRYFTSHHLAIPRKPMIAAVPISLRAAGDTSSDNQASLSFISLGTHLADPLRRLSHIRAASASMKATMGSLKSVLPTDFPSIGVPWLMEAARSVYGRAKVAEKIPPVATLVISNVPGPQVPLYLAGARMLTNYPTSIIVHGLALNVTVQSYDRHMDFA